MTTASFWNPFAIKIFNNEIKRSKISNFPLGVQNTTAVSQQLTKIPSSKHFDGGKTVGFGYPTPKSQQ